MGMATKTMIGGLLFWTALVCEMSLSIGKPLELEVTINGHRQVENGTERILFGELAENHAYPWQVKLVFFPSGFPQCGGSILCPDYVMTAAHCLDGFVPEQDFEIVVGVNKVGDPGEQRRRVKKTIIHPETSPLYLPLPYEPDLNVTGTRFAVSGWGTTETEDNPSNLRVVSMFQFNSVDCPFQPYRICAGGAGGSCDGDSGGPVAWTDPRTREVKLVGLVSLGWAKCPNRPTKDFPNEFSRISSVVNWINENTKGCNQKVCSKGQCMTKNKLKPQARRIMKRQPK